MITKRTADLQVGDEIPGYGVVRKIQETSVARIAWVDGVLRGTPVDVSYRFDETITIKEA